MNDSQFTHEPIQIKKAKRQYHAMTYPGDLGTLASEASGGRLKSRVNLKKILAIAAMVLCVMWLSVGSRRPDGPVGKFNLPSLKFTVMRSIKHAKNKQMPVFKLPIMPSRLPSFSISPKHMPLFRQTKKAKHKTNTTRFYQPPNKELSI